MNEPGTLSYGTGGALHISVDAEKYRIEAEDLKNLLFYGRVIPICEDRSRTTPGGILVSEVAIEGHAAMNASGKRPRPAPGGLHRSRRRSPSLCRQGCVPTRPRQQRGALCRRRAGRCSPASSCRSRRR